MAVAGNGASNTLIMFSTQDLTGLDDYSVSMWIKPFSAPGSSFDRFASISQAGANDVDLTVSVYWSHSSASFRNCFLFNDSGYKALKFSPVPPTNQWTHIACCRENDVCEAFVNGVSSGTLPMVAPTLTSSNAAVTMFNRNGTYNQGIDGAAAEFLFLDRALTADEIRALANGAPALSIGRENQRAYLPLMGTWDEEPDWSPQRLTQALRAETDYDEHAPVAPWGWIDGGTAEAEAAEPPTFVPAWARRGRRVAA